MFLTTKNSLSASQTHHCPQMNPQCPRMNPLQLADTTIVSPAL